MNQSPIAIPLPLAPIGSVNVWLLRGRPLTLVDTGPRDAAALAALEEGLGAQGLRVEDIELVLATPPPVDPIGLAATIQRRSGATVAVLGALADHALRHDERVDEDRCFSHALMRFHGVPDEVVDGDEEFWAFLRDGAE